MRFLAVTTYALYAIIFFMYFEDKISYGEALVATLMMFCTLLLTVSLRETVERLKEKHRGNQ